MDYYFYVVIPYTSWSCSLRSRGAPFSILPAIHKFLISMVVVAVVVVVDLKYPEALGLRCCVAIATQ
ncbi:hypothetical protein BJX61DRAFT_528558, partial [Aspergillus egyptiacus]